MGAYYLSKNLNKSLTSTKTPPPNPPNPTTLPPNPPIPTTLPPNLPTPPPRQPKGTLGSLCLTTPEHGTFIANAPEGTHFTQVLFADYGQPECLQYTNCSAVGIINSGDPTYDGYTFPFWNKYWGSTVIDNTTTQLSTDVNNDTMLVDPCPGQAKWFTAVIQYVWE